MKICHEINQSRYQCYWVVLEKNFYATSNIDECANIVSIAGIANILPVSNAWPKRSGSAIKRFKTNKRSTPESDVFNALTIISIKGPKWRTTKASYLTKQTSISFWEHQKRYKKNTIKKKRQNMFSHNGPYRFRVPKWYRQAFGMASKRLSVSHLTNVFSQT